MHTQRIQHSSIYVYLNWICAECRALYIYNPIKPFYTHWHTIFTIADNFFCSHFFPFIVYYIDIFLFLLYGFMWSDCTTNTQLSHSTNHLLFNFVFFSLLLHTFSVHGAYKRIIFFHFFILIFVVFRIFVSWWECISSGWLSLAKSHRQIAIFFYLFFDWDGKTILSYYNYIDFFPFHIVLSLSFVKHKYNDR